MSLKGDENGTELERKKGCGDKIGVEDSPLTISAAAFFSFSVTCLIRYENLLDICCRHKLIIR